MNPPNSEPRARTTPLATVVAEIESICTFDHNSSPQADASAVWMIHLQEENEGEFDIFLFDLLSDLQDYETHMEQLYLPTGPTPDPRLAQRTSSVARVRHGLLCAKSCSWGRFIQIFDDSFRQNLSLLDELAQHEFKEFEAPDDELDLISSRVEDLVTEVDASSLDPQLKKLILQNLHDILSSIHTSEFGSTRSLRQTLDALLVAFLRSHHLFKSVTDPTQLSLIHKLSQIISKIDMLTADALHLTTLAAPMTQQLLALQVGP